APNTVAKLRGAAGHRSLDEALEAAWHQSRERFVAWAAREEAAARAESADDLDRALADAASPEASAEHLAALASSEDPRVRQLVAQTPSTPSATLARLASDRERVVREAAVSRRQ